MGIYDVAKGTMNFSDKEKVEYLPVLKEGNTFIVEELYKTTIYLMQMLMIHSPNSNSDQQHIFTEAQDNLLLPFGLVYAAIAGNVFGDFSVPKGHGDYEGGTVYQYNSDAFCRLAANQLTAEELKNCIKFAYEALDKVDSEQLDVMLTEHRNHVDEYWKTHKT